MAIIYIEFKPKSIRINSGRGDYSGDSEQYIYMRGIPGYDGNASFEFKKDGQKVEFPRKASVRISVRAAREDWYWEREKKILANSWLEEDSKFIGILHYFVSSDASNEASADSSSSLEMKIYVSEEQFATYINLISSRKSIITAVGTISNGTKDHSIEVEPLGYHVTWDLDKSNSVCLEGFNLDFTYPNQQAEEDDEPFSLED